jgi:hypothetical protein
VAPLGAQLPPTACAWRCPGLRESRVSAAASVGAGPQLRTRSFARTLACSWGSFHRAFCALLIFLRVASSRRLPLFHADLRRAGGSGPPTGSSWTDRQACSVGTTRPRHWISFTGQQGTGGRKHAQCVTSPPVEVVPQLLPPPFTTLDQQAAIPAASERTCKCDNGASIPLSSAAVRNKLVVGPESAAAGLEKLPLRSDRQLLILVLAGPGLVLHEAGLALPSATADLSLKFWYGPPPNAQERWTSGSARHCATVRASR